MMTENSEVTALQKELKDSKWALKLVKRDLKRAYLKIDYLHDFITYELCKEVPDVVYDPPEGNEMRSTGASKDVREYTTFAPAGWDGTYFFHRCKECNGVVPSRTEEYSYGYCAYCGREYLKVKER